MEYYVANGYFVNNEKYNINFIVEFDNFINFIKSLKESKKYYHELCENKNIKIIDFDNEYIKNIDILHGELLKYYILIIYNNSDTDFIVINDDIKDLYNFMVKQINIYTSYNNHNVLYNKLILPESELTTEYSIEYHKSNYIYNTENIYLIENNIDFISRIDINNLTKKCLSRLIDIYASNTTYFICFRQGYLKKMNINNKESTIEYNKSKKLYLDSLKYESNNERELSNILNNLLNICLSNINDKYNIIL